MGGVILCWEGYLQELEAEMGPAGLEAAGPREPQADKEEHLFLYYCIAMR